MPDPSSARAKHAAVLSGQQPAPRPGARPQYGAILSGQAPAPAPNGTRAKATQAIQPPPTPATVEGSVILTTNQMAQNLVQHLNDAEHGPSVRVKAARSMLGVAYKQQTGTELRAGSSPAALEYMDCSEFVSRVLAVDGITKGVLPMDTKALKRLLSDKARFSHSPDTPRVGDIALWEGHVGVVSGVGKGNTMKLIHAAGKGKLSNENKYAIKPSQYRSGTFYGYYRPIGEVGGQLVHKLLTEQTAPVAGSGTPRGHRAGPDGSFPLQEVFVRPAPGQVVGPGGLPRPVSTPVAIPAGPGIPRTLPSN